MMFLACVMQKLLLEEKAERVSSIDQLGAYAFLPLDFSLAGLLIDQFSGDILFFVTVGANNLLALTL